MDNGNLLCFQYKKRRRDPRVVVHLAQAPFLGGKCNCALMHFNNQTYQKRQNVWTNLLSLTLKSNNCQWSQLVTAWGSPLIHEVRLDQHRYHFSWQNVWKCLTLELWKDGWMRFQKPQRSNRKISALNTYYFLDYINLRNKLKFLKACHDVICFYSVQYKNKWH